MTRGTSQIVRGNALTLPLADDIVDLIVTSPPYFGLRSYQDGGIHYDGQLGSEATPAEFVDALLAATAEMVRVLKPSGSLWVNLGDKYASTTAGSNWYTASLDGGRGRLPELHQNQRQATRLNPGVQHKSLIGIPWRYAIACIDQLGLILRAEVIWSKPNGLPESVTDRVRRSHEQWFHFVRQPRYFSAVDEIREEHARGDIQGKVQRGHDRRVGHGNNGFGFTEDWTREYNPLGKLPGSVWSIPTQPLTVPAHLGVDHFAAFPMEWPRRIIQGWSPSGVCTACGEGRRPVIAKEYEQAQATNNPYQTQGRAIPGREPVVDFVRMKMETTITGYACACTHPTASTTPAIVLDPFGGTGTVALVAKALGRHGISLDMSADYCRLAGWRTTDEGELARALQVDRPAKQVEGQWSLFEAVP